MVSTTLKWFAPFVLSLLCLSSSFAQEKLSVETLIAQIKGNRCSIKARCVEEDEGESLLSRIFQTSTDRCRCIAHAAFCLLELKSDRKAAVPALIDALNSGITDYNNGDGGEFCLSAVLSNLRFAADPRAIDPLIDYLKSPRLVDMSFATARHFKRTYVGIPTAIDALADIGPPAIRGKEILLTFYESPRKNVREACLRALLLIGAPEVVHIAKAKILEFVVQYQEISTTKDPLGSMVNNTDLTLEAKNFIEKLALYRGALTEIEPELTKLFNLVSKFKLPTINDVRQNTVDVQTYINSGGGPLDTLKTKIQELLNRDKGPGYS